MADLDFQNVGLLKQSAFGLLNQWGFNYYRKTEHLREDDLLVRSKVGWLLGLARKSVDTAESVYRREKLPPLSREKSRHDAEAIAGAQKLERLSKTIGALQGQMTVQPTPENDRTLAQYLEEAATLQKLLEWDAILVAQADLLRAKLDQKSGDWLLQNETVLQDDLAILNESLRNRQLILFPF